MRGAVGGGGDIVISLLAGVPVIVNSSEGRSAAA
jgi:hypothetical protein